MSINAHNLSGMTLELWKMAQGGEFEKKLPWYSAAGGALLGGAAGGSLAPKKFKLLGQLAGTLAGTGVGLEGGQALGKKLDQRKMAKQAAFEDPKKPSAAKVLGSSLTGMGGGMLAGYGGAHAANALSRATGGSGIKGSTAAKAMPFVGGAIGMAAPLLHYATLQRMREEHARKQQERANVS